MDTGMDANGKPREQSRQTPMYKTCMDMFNYKTIAAEIKGAQQALFEFVAAKEKIQNSEETNEETKAAEVKARAAIKKLVDRKAQLYKDKSLDQCPVLLTSLEQSCSEFLNKVASDDSPFKNQSDLFKGLLGAKVSSVEKFIYAIFPKVIAQDAASLVSLFGSIFGLPPGPSLIAADQLVRAVGPNIDEKMYSANNRKDMYKSLQEKAEDSAKNTQREMERIEEYRRKNNLIRKTLKSSTNERSIKIDNIIEFLIPSIYAETKKNFIGKGILVPPPNTFQFPCLAN